MARAVLAITLSLAAGGLVTWALFGGSAEREQTVGVPQKQSNDDPVSVRGRISDTDGAPLTVATVCAYGRHSLQQLVGECVATDNLGRFELALASGDYSFTASATGHASATAEFDVTASSRELDFVLEPRPTPTVGGLILSATGVPIAKARVAIYRDTQLVSHLLTDDVGRFTAWTSAGELQIKAEAVGFGAMTVRTTAPSLDVRITLFPGNQVAGRVLMEGSLHPVPDVLVVATNRPDRLPSRVDDAATRTDQNGAFQFTNLPMGSWHLQIADRHVWGESSDAVVTTSGEKQENVTLIVRQAAAVSGSLLVGDADLPCPAGQVQLIPESMVRTASADQPDRQPAALTQREDSKSDPILGAKSDKLGRVQFDAVPFGKYRIGPICPEHQLLSGNTSLEVNGEPIATQVWKFTRGLSVVVAVEDEAGRPLENAAVSLILQEPGNFSRRQVLAANRSGLTDSLGRYRFGGLQAKRYVASASFTRLNGDRGATATIDLTSGVEPQPVTLTLPGVGLIRVHSRSASNAPLSQILFFAVNSQNTRYEGKYEGDGRFSIGPLPRESYRVFAYDNKNPKLPLNDGRPVQIAGAGTIDLSFVHAPLNAAIEGKVVDGHGVGLPGALVRAVSMSLDATDEMYAGIQTVMHGPQEQMTDGEGRFRILGLDPKASYDLHIDHLSGLAERRNSLRPGSFVTVALPLAAKIVGTVVNELGTAEEFFDVVFDTRDNSQSNSRSFSRTAGRFELENVYPGRVVVTVYSNDGDRSASREMTLSPGQAADAGRFVLKPDVVESTSMSIR